MSNDEIARLRNLYKHESRELSSGKRLVCGVDEAGRGPLAGPVVAAAVILPVLESDEDFGRYEFVNDSKKLTKKKRELLYSRLVQCQDNRVGVGIVSEKVIDTVNIFKAAGMCMMTAIKNLGIRPCCVLVDGMRLPDLDIPQRKIIGGDALSLSIAAASIIAKVVRDRIMVEYDEKYPQYGFDRHKGYGTKEHLKKLRDHGPCIIHRRSFRPINLMAEIGIETE